MARPISYTALISWIRIVCRKVAIVAGVLKMVSAGEVIINTKPHLIVFGFDDDQERDWHGRNTKKSS